LYFNNCFSSLKFYPEEPSAFFSLALQHSADPSAHFLNRELTPSRQTQALHQRTLMHTVGTTTFFRFDWSHNVHMLGTSISQIVNYHIITYLFFFLLPVLFVVGSEVASC
jgi:hypothetical protein